MARQDTAMHYRLQYMLHLYDLHLVLQATTEEFAFITCLNCTPSCGTGSYIPQSNSPSWGACLFGDLLCWYSFSLVRSCKHKLQISGCVAWLQLTYNS